jgi:NitT/TauT family transport system substrate-binding protein
MRNVLSSLFGAFVVVLALAVAAARAQERLILGYTNLQSAKMPVALGKEAGLFAKQGLDVELVRVTPGNTAIPKLLSGEIHLFLGNGDPVVKAILQDGAKLAIIASLGEDSFKLIARSSIRNIEELKGKRVGVSNPGSSADRIARLAIEALKLDPDQDVQLVATGLNESRARLDLLLKGEIDATIVATENVVALGEKATAISAIAELEDLGIFVSGADISATRHFIETRRETVKRFLTALVEAIAKAKADPDLTRRIYHDYANTTEPAALDWRTREFVHKRIAAMPHPNRRAIVSYFRDAGHAGPPNFDAVADFSLLREIESAKNSGR